MNTQVATGEGFEDRQFVVLASEKQARVVALPSQNCQYRQQLAESHIVIKAEITSLKGMYRKYPFFRKQFISYLYKVLSFRIKYTYVYY